MHGFDVESVHARQRHEMAQDQDLWELTTKDKASVGVVNAPGYQPTLKYAKLTADEKQARRAAAGKEGRAAANAAGGAPKFDARMRLHDPHRAPVEPRQALAMAHSHRTACFVLPSVAHPAAPSGSARASRLSSAASLRAPR